MLSTTAPVYAIDKATTQILETGTGTAATSDTALSASDLARARAWGLSAVEWQRYQWLMQGMRGSVSPATISPIEVLGIHARDREERRRQIGGADKSVQHLPWFHLRTPAHCKRYPRPAVVDV